METSDRFVLDLESIKEEIKSMERLHKRLQDASEQIKTVHTAAGMKQLQTTMDADIDHVFAVSKTIIQRLQDLDHSGDRSSIDPTNSTHIVVIRGLGNKIKDMMDGFKGLRVKIVGLYKETIESIYCTVTKEKESVETIENILTTGELDIFLRVAGDEGSVGILDVVQEIQERINNAKYMQNYMMELHSMFLDMVSLVEAQRQKLSSSDHKKGSGGVKDDVKMDPQKRATIAIILVIFFLLLAILIVSLIILEKELMRV